MDSTEVASRPDGNVPPAEPRLSHGVRKLTITPVAAFPHQSRPGYYGITFSGELKERLRVLVTAMIPGGESYPPAGEAQVVEFLEARSSGEDRDWLTDVAGRFDGKTVASATDALTQLEADEPDLFAPLLQFVYHGYYSSHRVLAAMTDRGYAYHGAPQPLGYVTDPNLLAPPSGKGSYIPTSEVTRVQL